MALKKSELHSSLWQSCDELRGGMDASPYKDYVLVLLFVKYVSDKYAGQPFAPITIPSGAGFADMVALKGKSDIGDQINKKMVGNTVAGIAVHIGARVATAAQPGEVIVSSTVKDLVAGSGLRFEDRGVQTLKGLPEPWRLFKVEAQSALG